MLSHGHSALFCPSAVSGLSKLAVIAATKIHARLHPSLKVNSCCPGYCECVDAFSVYTSNATPFSEERATALLTSRPLALCMIGSTDMTSHKGPRPPQEGAQNAVVLACMPNCPSGAFYQDLKPSVW